MVAKSSTLPQKDIVDAIERNYRNYDLIIHVVMSSGLSSASWKVAENVRKQYEDAIPIINVDSRQAANGVGSVLLGIIDIIKNNDDLSIEEIEKLCQQVVENTYSYFIFPDLNYLYKGGRIGRAQSLMGSLLHIIPIVGMMGDDPEGIVSSLGKGRTFKQVNNQIINLIKTKMEEKSASKIKRAVFLSGYGEKNRDVAEELVEKVRALPCDDFVLGKAGLVDAVYCGPGAYGVSILL